MKRQVIQIDEDKCNGCGICVSACHEGAIGMVNGKAKLLRDDYCDGLGNCLPACPTGAITFVEREAAAYDEEAVKKNMENKAKALGGCPGSSPQSLKTGNFGKCPSMTETVKPATYGKMEGGCPGSKAKALLHEEAPLPCGCPGSNSKSLKDEQAAQCSSNAVEVESQLGQWPVQIKLVPVNAPYFENADLLIAADCCAYACGDFHNKYIKGKITIIGCPKLDSTDYTEKLAAIIQTNNIKSITVSRMEVPCCANIVNWALEAVRLSGKEIEVKTVILKVNGKQI